MVEARRLVRTEDPGRLVSLPEFPFSVPSLTDIGVQSAGVDFVVASLNGHHEPHFLFERCKETKKTFRGQLSHPKETLKASQSGVIENLDNAFRRCFRQELGVEVDAVDFHADPDRLSVITDTFVQIGEEIKRYKAAVIVLWTPDFSWFPPTVDTDEVEEIEAVGLTQILNSPPTIFRECTVDVFTLLAREGFFDRPTLPVSQLLLATPSQLNGKNGYTDISLNTANA